MVCTAFLCSPNERKHRRSHINLKTLTCASCDAHLEPGCQVKQQVQHLRPDRAPLAQVGATPALQEAARELRAHVRELCRLLRFEEQEANQWLQHTRHVLLHAAQAQHIGHRLRFRVRCSLRISAKFCPSPFQAQACKDIEQALLCVLGAD